VRVDIVLNTSSIIHHDLKKGPTVGLL